MEADVLRAAHGLGPNVRARRTVACVRQGSPSLGVGERGKSGALGAPPLTFRAFRVPFVSCPSLASVFAGVGCPPPRFPTSAHCMCAWLVFPIPSAHLCMPCAMSPPLPSPPTYPLTLAPHGCSFHPLSRTSPFLPHRLSPPLPPPHTAWPLPSPSSLPPARPARPSPSPLRLASPSPLASSSSSSRSTLFPRPLRAWAPSWRGWLASWPR